jgi:hypothetical protein
MKHINRPKVNFPDADYKLLRDLSRLFNIPMAVIIRKGTRAEMERLQRLHSYLQIEKDKLKILQSEIKKA